MARLAVLLLLLLLPGEASRDADRLKGSVMAAPAPVDADAEG
jgi:hypothetical protein